LNAASPLPVHRSDPGGRGRARLFGGIMFKVFVGRDEKREFKEDQLAKFRALADTLEK
jgi:hypothetical protein